MQARTTASTFVNTTYYPSLTLVAFHTNKKQYLDTLHIQKKCMKIWTPNSCCTDNTWFFLIFLWIFGSCSLGDWWTLRRSTSKSLLCIRRCISFVHVMYLNIASYLCGKQIKSKLRNTMCLWMIFIWVHLKRLGLNKCRTKTLYDGAGLGVLNGEKCEDTSSFLLFLEFDYYLIWFFV